MKKYLSAFCSITASILIFATLSIEWIRYKLHVPVYHEQMLNGWDLINTDLLRDKAAFVISAILLVVLAIVLLLVSTLIILQNLKVIKTDYNFKKINAGLLTIFAILSILAAISTTFLRPLQIQGIKEYNINLSIEIAGTYFMPIFGVLACVFGWIFSRQPKEKKEATEQNNKTQNVVENQNPQTQNVVTEPTYSTQNNVVEQNNTNQENINQ